jgi:hypothetical protein
VGGSLGRGAALFGLVLAGRPAQWGASFPHNAFAVPVTVAPPGAAAALARGLAEAGTREAVAAARLAREARAVLAASTPSEITRADEEVRSLSGLGWSELTAEERAFAPPLFLVASEEALARELPDLLELLHADLPVAVLSLAEVPSSRLGEVLLALTVAGALSGLGPGEAAPPEPIVARSSVARADRDEGAAAASGADGGAAVLGQTSVAHADHLERAVSAVVAAGGRSLLRVLAPSPARGGFPPEALLDRAREEVASRAFPLFLRRPTGDGAALLDLTGNPPEGDRAVEGAPAASSGTTRGAWLALNRAAGSGQVFAAADAAAVELKTAEAAEQAHREEVAALRAAYEARLAELAAGARLELAQEVRARLLDLATRPKPLPGEGAAVETANGAPVAAADDSGTAGAAEAVQGSPAEAVDTPEPDGAAEVAEGAEGPHEAPR